MKPLLGDRVNCGLTLAAEVVGAVVGRSLELPIPEFFLVHVDARFIASVGGQLSDVEPGWAFGSRWVEQTFPVNGSAHLIQRVANAESAAGVVVLDTITQNSDRHGENALLEPLSEQRFQLWYIDNAYSLVGNAVGKVLVPHLCAPASDDLKRLVTSQSQFMPYLLAAEGLNIDVVCETIDTLKDLGWGVDTSYITNLNNHLHLTTQTVRQLVMNGLTQFPLSVRAP